MKIASNLVFGMFWGICGASIWWSVNIFGPFKWNMILGISHIILTIIALIVWVLNVVKDEKLVSSLIFGIVWGIFGASIWWSINVFEVQSWHIISGIFHTILTLTALIAWFLRNVNNESEEE